MKNKLLFLYGAWIVSLTATLGSLYFSEIRKFIPCELCWYQRIMMYPLVLILGIATFQGDARVKKYVLPMAVIGAGISLMHYMEQKFPDSTALNRVSQECLAQGSISIGSVSSRFRFSPLLHLF